MKTFQCFNASIHKSLICAFAMFSFSAIAYGQNPNSNPNAQGQWKLTGNNNADTNKFVGTINNVDLVFKRNNIESFRLLEDTAAKFSGDVFLDKFKEKPPINSGPPKEVFLKVDNQGKIISTDKSGLLESIYTSPSTCLSSGLNVNLPIWSASSTPTYGILYTGIDCPARVGIGTNNPVSTLQVAGDGFFQGNLGVNVAPTTINMLSIVNPVNRTGILLQNDHPTSITLKYGIKNMVNNPNTIAYSVTDQSTNQNVFVVKGDGSVIIEQNAPAMLKTISIKDNTSGKDVFRILSDGHIWATELDLALKEDFPDYVFDNSYKLMSLVELEKYITKNKHLPNIPTAKQIKEKGMSVGEMQVKQMEKIEELTLYVIELSKQIELLKIENERLKVSINH
ncbi:MAG: hypothetical protein RQ875_03100 [Vicingaceae bacterium]|nr:hypothetical protein [Vicingaceae bacterium]